MNFKKLFSVFIVIFLVVIFFFWLKGYFKKNVTQQTGQFPLVSLTPYPTWKPKPGLQRPTVTYEQSPYKTTDKTRKVEIVGCMVDNSAWGMSYLKKVVEIPNGTAPAAETMKVFLKEAAETGWGNFPTKNEVKKYAQLTGKRFSSDQVVLNSLTIDNFGNARVHFSREIESYGGGSARVACIHDSVELTLRQFPSIKNIILCIESVCADQKGSTIFQP